MRILKRIIMLILAVSLLPVLPAAATDATQPTLPPYVEAVHDVETLPGSWSPLSSQTPEKELILELTADRLYKLSNDGSEIAPSMAAAIPEDVTLEYTGRYGVPKDAVRGYAYRIELDPNACWDDGAAVTAADWVFTLQTMLRAGKLELAVADKEAYQQGKLQGTGKIISLTEAGFDTVDQARAAGHREFFVDTGGFWGLNSGWKSITDRTRLMDEAIPFGCDERYVSGAYLYRRYLEAGGIQDHFQPEFVGVWEQLEDVFPLESVGILRTGVYQIVLVLSRPETADMLALELESVVPLRQDRFDDDYATSVETYSATGPYRVMSVTGSEIRLERNPYWCGSWEAFPADAVRFLVQADIGTCETTESVVQ